MALAQWEGDGQSPPRTGELETGAGRRPPPMGLGSQATYRGGTQETPICAGVEGVGVSRGIRGAVDKGRGSIEA